MSFVAFRGAIELGLVYGFVALGLFLSFKILKIADMTVEGSFTFGAAISMVMTVNGNPALGIVLSVLFGAIAGLITAFLQTVLKIQPVLAGILNMSALYSINLKVMGNKSTINSLNQNSIFTWFKDRFGDNGKLLLIFIFMVAAAVLLTLFLNTQLGLAIRATGDNASMVRSSSINSKFTTMVNLVIANALVGLSGGILAQYQASADASMGVGVAVIGLASLIIGEVIFGKIIFAITKKRNMLTAVISTILGSILYRIIIAFVLQYSNLPILKSLSITASDMRMLSALIVVIAISYPVIKDMIQLFLKKRRNRNA